MRPMIDGHLDLAMNLVYYDRNITLELAAMNVAEQGLVDQPFRGKGTVSLPEMRAAGIGVCLATLLARSGPEHRRRAEYRRADLDYAIPSGAYSSCWAQLGNYHLLERAGELVRLTTRRQLVDHWNRWISRTPDETLPIGIILSVEGADPIPDPDHLEEWYGWGVRAIGPSHYGQGRYAAGTGTPGPLTPLGLRLIDEMQRLGIALDVTHLADVAIDQALDRFDGPVWASHHNCRSLVDWDRQLSDRHLQRLIDRDAVIGLAFDAVMLAPGWVRGSTSPETLSIEAAADHVDHIVQLAGSVRHCAIGTDLDGGYGHEQTPREVRSIRDIHRLEAIFERRGYSSAEIDAIFWGNWLRKLSESLPEA
ncbi:MAG TPA: peptidase [Planctomycetaceae bacterium]|nr:peptidase [Planctomycetaceae bacterium]HRF02791.1 membrane dipeptidase [Pirellulaceae bacterium]